MIIEVIFDLESQRLSGDDGKFDPAKMGVSIVSLYKRQLNDEFKEVSGEMMSFWEKDIPEMWKHFSEADRIIGFNSLGFDVPALKPLAPKEFASLPHFDMLQKLKLEAGFRVSLSRLARGSLGEDKTDQGIMAPEYWQRGDPESLTKLKSYCEADVMLTTKVYDFGRANNFLKFIDHWNNPRQVAVDFSYPLDFAPTGKQTSLF